MYRNIYLPTIYIFTCTVYMCKCRANVASSQVSSQILSCSCGENSGSGLGTRLEPMGELYCTFTTLMKNALNSNNALARVVCSTTTCTIIHAHVYIYSTLYYHTTKLCRKTSSFCVCIAMSLHQELQ